MTSGRASRITGLRGAMMALALLALAIKVLVPQGYMAADHASATGFPLVICTAGGRITLDPPGEHAPAEKAKGDSPCAFAGNITPPTPSPIALANFTAWSFAPAPLPAQPEQTPGRGLAAPPPPAIGPPSLI